MVFRGRETAPSDFDVTAQTWYQRAVTEDGPGWSMLKHLPYRDRPAIVTSTPIVIDGDFSGVIAIVVELERLFRIGVYQDLLYECGRILPPARDVAVPVLLLIRS